MVTAKAGLVGFTRALAHDLADDGITVNCVVPGLIGTPRPKDKPEPAHHATHQTITGARGHPEDVAVTVRFLCGPGARYINGQAIHSNGGAYLGARARLGEGLGALGAWLTAQFSPGDAG